MLGLACAAKTGGDRGIFSWQCSCFVLIFGAMFLPPLLPPPPRGRNATIEQLRRLLPQWEGFAPDTPSLPFGIAAIDSHLPHGGLAFGALHEVVAETEADRPAALGFVAALLGRVPRGGPVLLVLPRHGGFIAHGRPHGHGLHAFGLCPADLILVETTDNTHALWALEEALRSAAPAAVAGGVERLDLKASQRLHRAARASGLPLLLLRPAQTLEASVAATRWRVGTAPAARDHYGLIARWRWRLRLERCRNGRPGDWMVEFDHVAHRFSLAATLVDPALSRRGDPQLRRAG